jgi:hypothetical protein
VFRELSVTEQRYQAVLSVIEGRLQIGEAAAKAGVTRQALHSWLNRYAGGRLEAPESGYPAPSRAAVPLGHRRTRQPMTSARRRSQSRVRRAGGADSDGRDQADRVVCKRRRAGHDGWGLTWQ